MFAFLMTNWCALSDLFTVLRRLTTRIRSEKCVVRRFCHCANVILCTYSNLDSIAYYTVYTIQYSLLPLVYKPIQHVTVLNAVGSCDTAVSVVMIYCNVMGPPSYMWSVFGQNVMIRSVSVLALISLSLSFTHTHTHVNICGPSCQWRSKSSLWKWPLSQDMLKDTNSSCYSQLLLSTQATPTTRTVSMSMVLAVTTTSSSYSWTGAELWAETLTMRTGGRLRP
jgi:hypothetical protein